MAKTRKNPRRNSEFVSHGILYRTKLSDGTVKVRKGGTAKGQNRVIGVFNVTTKTWQHDAETPLAVKRHVEQIYCPA